MSTPVETGVVWTPEDWALWTAGLARPRAVDGTQPMVPVVSEPEWRQYLLQRYGRRLDGPKLVGRRLLTMRDVARQATRDPPDTYPSGQRCTCCGGTFQGAIIPRGA